MYPTISDLLQDLFGINIPLPIQSFGFMMAISFMLAAYTLQSELVRKEKQGILHSFWVNVVKGAPATRADILGSLLTGFFVGYKVLYAAMNYSEFVVDTQGVLLSAKGNLIGGLFVGAIMLYMRYREGEKNRLPELVHEDQELFPHQLVMNITFVAAIAGIIGAKLFHNLENLDDLKRDPIDALLSYSGLTMYGGLICGAIAVIYYGKKHKIGALDLSDATAPGLMLAYGTGRLGCQLAGDGDWGIVNMNPKPSLLNWIPDWAWSYSYPNNVINSGIPIPGCEGRHCMMLTDAVYPTPLYEAIACILLFFVLWSVRKKFTTSGKLFSLYLLLNGMERMSIEQIRVNNKFELFGLLVTQAEVIAAVLMLLGILGLVVIKKNSVLNKTK